MQLQHSINDAIKTARTNGLWIQYSTQFFMPLSKAARIGLMLHEVLHVVFFHVDRRGDRDAKIWNAACDYVINIIIIDNGFTLPDGGLLDFRYRDLSPEDIYDLLIAMPPEDRPELPMGDLEEGEVGTASEAESEQIKAQIDNILIQASIQAQESSVESGSIPGELARYIDKLLNPIVPWHRVLKRFLTSRAKRGTTLRRPNKRFFPKHLLPSRYSVSMCEITSAVDVSGSTTTPAFDHYCAESLHILKSMKPKKMTFIQFDTTLKPIVELKTLSDFGRVKFTGYGGTDINPLMEWAAKHKPALLLVFTDGYFEPSLTNPKVPVVWVIDSNPDFNPDFGQVIHFNFSDL
jgi:predicted metal-dependent peptidase